MTSPSLTRLPQWQALAARRDALGAVHLRELFARDADRARRFALEAGPLYIDYSKQRIDDAALGLLIELARARDAEAWRDRMLAGEAVNAAEGRAALHTALRGAGPAAALAEARATLERMRALSRALRGGQWRGATGEALTDVISIGIGGSDLGPRAVAHALGGAGPEAPRVHYVANVDPRELDRVLARCRPGATAVLTVSKTFGTAETLLNARTARDWLARTLGADLSLHLIAVTSNIEAARAFGVAAERILPLPDWVGGRFSLWSAVGLGLMIEYGEAVFDALLAGAAELDAHFLAAPPERNAPLLLALLTLWSVNFWDARVRAVLPYAEALSLLPDHLQQLSMESNGKRSDRAGRTVDYATAPVLFGNVGANSQHSFHQLFHQGTQLVPSDFIVVAPGADERSRLLAASALAQTAALMHGVEGDAATPGNQPSTTIVLPALDARSLGALLALYEHQVFFEGVLWNLNSFDQPGVELGKRIAGRLLPALDGAEPPAGTDASTRALLQRLNRK